ncbi:hypothetical protein EUTSA_v10015101mg [Eutrema salsugineum]|uniref:Uncharacterized protein n=1 Tax=Eutrema salsugineum TaxID=72664 RepID=V4LL61_EUTSA|nr:hypothetical protein EUTSA_v10015101mg [Eutrema salsugineum]
MHKVFGLRTLDEDNMLANSHRELDSDSVGHLAGQHFLIGSKPNSRGYNDGKTKISLTRQHDQKIISCFFYLNENPSIMKVIINLNIYILSTFVIYLQFPTQ